MANALEQLIEQGIARGRAEGERQGYEKAVRRAIEVRFGAMPEVLARYLDEADQATLERLLERVYTVARPEDLLGG
jgi:flagellar biosynthesis/type III secretory pathway protein FliH